MAVRYFISFLLVVLSFALSGCGGGRSGPWARPSAAPANDPPSVLSGMSGEIAPEPQQGVVGVLSDPSVAVFSETLSGDGPRLSEEVPPPAAGVSLPPVRVGLLVPLSGSKAAIGQSMLNAAQMAVFDSGLETFEILPRDTGDSPERARGAAQEAVSAGAQILLGPLTAPAARACAPLAQANALSMLSFSTDWTVSSSGPLVMGFMPFGQVRRMADWAAENGLRRIAILAPDNEYGNAAVKTFQNRSRDLGLALVSTVRFSPANEVLDSEVNALLAQAGYGSDGLPALDAVFLPMPGEKAAKISRLLTQAGLSPDRTRRLGTGLWDDPSLALDPALSGAVFAAPPPSLRKDFERRYSRLYGHAPPRLSTLAYDATALAAVLARSGLERAGRPAFGRGDVLNPNGFAGLDGIFRFRSDGMAERGVAVLTFSNGSILEIVPAPQTFQAPGRADGM